TISTHYPLTLSGYSKPDLALSLNHDLSVVSLSVAERMAGQIATLLEKIVANSGASLDDFSLFTEQEWQQILSEWNSTAQPYPHDRSVPELFEMHAANTPDKVAVVQGHHQLSYRQLNIRANQLAHYLRRIGVQPDACVGVLLNRSLELIWVLLGILKAGAAYVPLNPDYPAERLDFMQADAGMTVVITSDHLNSRLSPGSIWTICVDSDAEILAKEATTNPENVLESRNIANVVYTSG